jgi:peptidyl-prolyl cis-trans isomerase D
VTQFAAEDSRRYNLSIMMRVLRKHRQWLMIVIAILAIPFIFYFVQKPDYGAMGRDQFARAYGRTVSRVEVQRNARLGNIAQALGMTSLWQTLSANEPGNSGYAEFAINLIVLRHEAERLGIQPTTGDVVDLVRNLPTFRGPSGFDPKKYEEFSGTVLAPNGFTDAEIDELARDELCLNRIKELLNAGVSIPEADSKTEFEQFYGKSFVSVVRLRAADFAKEVKIADEDVRTYYDAHKSEFKTEEKRKIEFVRLALSEEQKKLTGKERIDALQKLSDRAEDFTQALLEKGADFQQAAAKLQLPVQATGEFSASSPDEKLKSNPKLSGAAFQLTKQEPNSDVIEEGSDYYILHLAGVVEARPLTLEEAKPKIVDTLRTQRERELVSAKGAKMVHDLREALKAGTPLPRACEQAGVKAEKLEPFMIADDQTSDDQKAKAQLPDLPIMKNAVAQLQPGEVSDLVPSQDGGIIAILEKREPPDPAKYQANKTAFDERYLRNKRGIVFYEWLHDRQRAADVQFTKG